ncbi:Mis12-Mtw1 protein family-domain-containing protein [Delphinella strobiligena]|nr:Mis12-Mtw1 protein family-domain-containing protein [Delphinella strobiligena]
MNGAQSGGNKRKSTRHVFDADDEVPPTKKPKAEVATKSASGQAVNTGRNTGTRPASTRTTRASKSYDEDVGGFSFSRTRSKKTKAQAQPPPPTNALPQPEPEAEQQAPVDDEPTEPAAPVTRQKKKPRKTLPVSPEPNKLQAKTPQRRSKRLSGDNNPPPPNATQVTSNPAPSDPTNDNLSTPKQPVAPLDREESPQLQQAKNGQDLHVETKRRLTIPLPFADTPIIRRNKEMRKNSAENSRRSSSGMRGRRASSLIDSGASHAVPHFEVETQELYKHISQDLVEPKRMRQLLTWCGTRALPEKPSGGQMDAAETAAMHAARVIQEELLNEFGTKSELSSWFDREDTAPAVLVKKPNPRNLQNTEKLHQLEAELARLQEEKRSWDSLVPPTGNNTAERYPTASINLDPSAIDASLLDPSQSDILNTLLSNLSTKSEDDNHTPQAAQPSTTIDTVTAAQQRISSIAQTLEFKIDQFADSTHRMEQYRQTAERVADRILASGAQKLEERDRKLRERSNGAHGGNVDVIDTLRSLGRVLHDKSKGRS